MSGSCFPYLICIAGLCLQYFETLRVLFTKKRTKIVKSFRICKNFIHFFQKKLLFSKKKAKQAPAINKKSENCVLIED